MVDRNRAETAGLATEEAFEILGNETRMAILWALWESESEPTPFSKLRARVDVDSGNFNYHLHKLVGHFVRRTPEGYELREAGKQVIRAVHAGAITDDPRLDPTEIDEACPFCGATVELRYTDERLTARCTRCEGVVGGGYLQGTFLSYAFPPAGLQGRSPEAALQAAHTLYDSKVLPMMDGVCPECAGTTTGALDVCLDHTEPGDDGLCERCESRYRAWSSYTCDHCGYSRRFLVWFIVLSHPAVISFYHEHGDLGVSIPFRKLTWENARYIDAISESVVSTDPPSVRISVTLAGESLHATVDESLSVVEITQ